MEIYTSRVSELAGAMEITKYPNSPLIKSDGSKSVLVVYDGTNEYILGYISKGDTSNSVIIYSQHISGSIGHVLNDTYNMVQNADDLSSTKSRKNRTVLLGESQFIGSVFHDGVEGTKYGFGNKNWYTVKDYGGDAGEEAPVSPNKDDEHHFISLDNGNKLYQSTSGSLQEGNAIRVNIGVGAIDIHSYGTWDKSLLTVETPVERLERVITEGTYASGARIGFPDPSTYHVYNFNDNSSLFMGKNIIEIEKSNNNNSVFSKTIWDADGVLVEVDSAGIVVLKVNTTTLTVNDGTVNISGDMTFTGDLIVTGKLTVNTEVDLVGGKVIIDTAGKLLTTGGNDLA